MMMDKMNVIPYKDLIDAPSFKIDAARLSDSRHIHALLDNQSIPQDPDWQKRPGYVRQNFHHVVQNIDNTRCALARVVLAMTRYPVTILSDIDGTASAMVPLASDSRLVPGYKEAAVKLSHAYKIDNRAPSQLTFITGRSEEDAQAILTQPGPEICQNAGNAQRILLEQNSTALALPVICSHGTVMLTPEGEKREIPLTEEQQAFINEAYQHADWMQTNYPSVVVQKKHSGIDIKDSSGANIAEIREKLKAFCNSPKNPLIDGTHSFAIHDEGDIESSIRFERADKARAIKEFVLSMFDSRPGTMLVYIGDSYGVGGTDRRAAEFVQSLGGIAIQILNDRPQNVPGPEDSFRPDLILPNPDVAAKLLTHIAETKERSAFTPRTGPVVEKVFG